MRYLPINDADERAMLDAIGAASIDELFSTIPAAARLGRPLDIPGPMSELELRRKFGALARQNAAPDRFALFLGAGAYHHYIPAAVDQLLLRSEFFTAYTPYQPEIAQGTLTSIFEFQTHLCLLTGLEVSNASLYDGATGLAEAVLMAYRLAPKADGRRRVIVSKGVHPQYRATLATYTANLPIEVVEVGLGEDGRTAPDDLRQHCDPLVFAVVTQSPNYFGVIEDVAAAAQVAQGCGALAIGVVAEALSLGLLKPPGELGCAIVAGEAQSFGVPLSLGGPSLGFLTCRDEYRRQMPGRLVGQTTDVDGQRGFVLTLATREQHIRREKATSNICTNTGLMALAANIFLSLAGKHGLAEMAAQCHSKAEHLKRQLTALPGCRQRFAAPVFNEFVLDLPVPAAAVLAALAARNILGGVDLGTEGSAYENSLLIAATEMNTAAEIASYARALGEILEGKR